MRYVPLFCLREGMMLGNNLWGEHGELILAKNTVLTREYIKSIEKLNFNGIYVEDDLSKDIQIIGIITDRVRAKTVKCIKNVFISTEHQRGIKDFKEMQQQIESIVEEILNNSSMVINMVDLKVFDDYTYYHSVNVAVLSIVLGSALGLRKEQLCELGFGAILHDIGKVFVKKDILCKEAVLSEDESEEMQNHSILGYEYIKKVSNVNMSSRIGILEHHEKFGGGGYPNNLKEEEISLFGRIISIADVYDAMTSDRPYRKAIIPSEVIEYIMGCSHSLFDPDLVNIFVRKIAPYPIGTCVLLSNGLSGIVLKNYESFSMRPTVRIFKKDDLEIPPYEICLSDREFLNVTITGVF